MAEETLFERKIRERRERIAAEEAAAEAGRIAAEEQRRALWGDVPVGLEDLFDPNKRGEEAEYVDRAQKYFAAGTCGQSPQDSCHQARTNKGGSPINSQERHHLRIEAPEGIAR
jgi:hypothetical protein